MNRPRPIISPLPAPTADAYRRLSPNFQEDPFRALPLAAREKAEALRIEVDARRGSARAAYEEMKGAQDTARRIKDRIDALTRQWGKPDDSPEVIVEIENKNRAAITLDAARTRYERATAAVTSSAAVLRRIETFLAEAGHRTFKLAPTIDAAPGRGETILAAVEKVRRQIEELRAEAQSAADAPISSDAAKKIALAQLDALARRGEPDADPVIEAGKEICFPAKIYPGEHMPAHRRDEIDLLSFVIWAARDLIAEKIVAAIEEAANDDEALSDAERAKRIAEANEAILDLERREEALICLAAAGGQRIERRPDADLRAVLGLADTAPDPRGLK